MILVICPLPLTIERIKRCWDWL